MQRLFRRSIRPPDDVTPNPNTPEEAYPGTVGPPSATPGDPNGVLVEGPDNPGWWPPRIVPSPWSGWPAEWATPNWGGGAKALAGTAWLCVDLNASLLATMPPYLVKAAPTLDATWLWNPDPDIYSCWEEFAKQLFWDYQLGEAFVIATAYYATGWPARFHVVPPWSVDVDWGPDGRRVYSIGELDVTGQMLHIRYQGSVDDARGHGPLDAGRMWLVALEVLHLYATRVAAGGGIPAGVLDYPPEELTAEQAQDLKAQWVAARMSSIGEPAVTSGGVTFTAQQINPRDMALLELSEANERHIASLFKVPPFLVGIPSGDSMTYANATSLFDFHWRSGLRPMAQTVMSALSEWALPRGTVIEVNRDAYIQPGPLERAQTDEILNRIRDEAGNPAKKMQEIRDAERFDDTQPGLQEGVLRG